MKIIAYHYIRSFDKRYPYFNFLNKKLFNKQLKFFEKKYGIIKDENEIFKKNNKVLLTFDDGIKDHMYAAKQLKKINRIGIFFPTTHNLVNNKFLNVHKTHLILGKIKPKIAMEDSLKFLKKKKINFNINDINKKFKNTYKNFKDNLDKINFKRLINYGKNVKYRNQLLNYLIKRFSIKIKPKDFYLTKKEIKKISKMGMIIGCHSHSHLVLSNLNYQQQLSEIKKSTQILKKITNNDMSFFCYPYGGKSTYNNSTKKILKKIGYNYSFIVDQKDSNVLNINFKPYELSRIDCNQFYEI